jgi:hypothetical protein
MTMSEHAFDPIPDEEQETEALVAPNATVTVKQLRDAIDSGRWEHDQPTTALWLNTSFPPAGREASELIVELTAHGIACS